MSARKASRAVRVGGRRKGTTTIRRGSWQFPYENDTQALDNWNAAVRSWGERDKVQS